MTDGTGIWTARMGREAELLMKARRTKMRSCDSQGCSSHEVGSQNPRSTSLCSAMTWLTHLSGCWDADEVCGSAPPHCLERPSSPHHLPTEQNSAYQSSRAREGKQADPWQGTLLCDPPEQLDQLLSSLQMLLYWWSPTGLWGLGWALSAVWSTSPRKNYVYPNTNLQSRGGKETACLVKNTKFLVKKFLLKVCSKREMVRTSTASSTG